MSDSGADISTSASDLEALGTIVDGNTALAQALARRLTTPRGGLFYDLDYGTDLRAYVNDGLTPGQVSEIRSAIQRECLKDDRVFDVDCDTSFNSAAQTLSVSIRVVGADGPFDLTLAISKLTVDLLQVS